LRATGRAQGAMAMAERGHARRHRSPTNLLIGLAIFLATAAPITLAAGPASAGVVAHARPRLTCTDSWNGGTGLWSDASDWSTDSVPGLSDNVCITASGTYTVTLEDLVSVNSLTIGGTSGTQTLEILADDVVASQLTLSADSTISANGVLTMSSTGESAYLRDTAITNHGQFTTSGSGPDSYNEIYSSFTNDGTVTLDGVHVGFPNSTKETNTGTWHVSPGVTFTTTGGPFIQRGGSLENDGTMTVFRGSFYDLGGTIEPLLFTRPIAVMDSLLDDVHATTGAFEMEGIGSGLRGSIGSKQKVELPTTGNNEVTLHGVVHNDGELLVNAGRGNVAELRGTGSLINDSRVDLLGAGTAQVDTAVVNEQGAFLSVDTSTTTALDEARTTNDGTLELGEGALLTFSGGGSLIDARSSSTDIIVHVGHGASRLIGGRVSLAGSLVVSTVGTPHLGSKFVVITNAAVAGKFAATHGGPIRYVAVYPRHGLTLVVA
jgi:hypothetical protein